MGPPKPREIAYQALRRSDAPGDFVEHRLEADPGFGALRPEDRRLAQELIFGVIRRRSTLDWLVARRTNGRRQRPDIRQLLHLGLYQLLFLDRIPPHAAVHETVELARSVGLAAQSGFLNAVLRETIRDLAATRQSLADLLASDLATATSHPKWLVDRWRNRLGLSDTTRMLQLNNTPPITFARVNTLRVGSAELQQIWEGEGVMAMMREFPWADAGSVFELKQHPPLAGLGSFQRGGFYVQDPSTLLAVRLLDPQPGESILDACAAPGGKTSLIAARLGNRGRILAEDANADRLPLLAQNVDRLGATCVHVQQAATDGTTDKTTPPDSELFDRVLVDVPCSNTGVLRRRVELRWRLQPTAMEALRNTQRQILGTAARRVRPGGVVVYSTCSLEPEENAGVVADFLHREPGFVEESRQEIVPWRDEIDGAFAVRLRRLIDGPPNRMP